MVALIANKNSEGSDLFSMQFELDCRHHEPHTNEIRGEYMLFRGRHNHSTVFITLCSWKVYRLSKYDSEDTLTFQFSNQQCRMMFLHPKQSKKSPRRTIINYSRFNLLVIDNFFNLRYILLHMVPDCQYKAHSISKQHFLSSIIVTNISNICRDKDPVPFHHNQWLGKTTKD